MDSYDKGFKIYKIVINFIFIIVSVSCILPFLMIVGISLSSENSILDYGYRLIPKEFSTVAYDLIFKNPFQVLNAYKTTLFITVIGTVVSVLLSSMFAYTVSRKDFVGARAFSFYLYFTALFSGGLVPFYILMTQYLHLQNTYLIMILPQIGSVWYIFLLRTFFQEIPLAITESAVIDGAGDVRIFFSFIIPLSKPVIATVSLFTALNYWNEWYNAMLFITDDRLIPLQYLLQRLLMYVQFITANMDKMPSGVASKIDLPQDSLRMAMVVIATGPMLVLFPFFQKYFVRGMSVGAVKG